MFALKLNDFTKGLAVAVLSAVLTTLYQMLQNGFGAIDYNQILLIAILSAISYLTKNFFSDSEGRILGKI